MIHRKIAGVAQLIERRLAKAKVAGLSPVSRSNFRSEIWSCHRKTEIILLLEITQNKNTNKCINVPKFHQISNFDDKLMTE